MMEEEKTLEDFFKSSEPSYKTKRNHKNHINKVVRIKPDSRFLSFFKKYFSFDYDVDLSNPTNVLYRKNYCIKNIISLLNVVFLLFSFVGISKSNYIITIVFFILVTVLSRTISYMLKRKKDDYSHQNIIMYLECLFVLLLSVVLYVKVFLGFTLTNGENILTTSQFSVTQAAYFLIYISMIIMALYQDPRLIKIMSIWSFAIITILHLTALHPDLYDHASSINELLNYSFKENKNIYIDILLRTGVFVVFYVVLYSTTSITHFMNEERNQEFNKRRGVETDFKDVVESVFEAVKAYNLNEDQFQENIKARRVKAVAVEIAKAMNYDAQEIKRIENFSLIHTDRIRELNLDEYIESNDTNFDIVMEKTKLATSIIKRLQLKKKAEDIVSTVFMGENDKDFLKRLSLDSGDYIASTVLLSEIYDVLRTQKSYKTALNHMRAIELIRNDFTSFFSADLILRFIKFNGEIKQAYEKA